MENSLMSHLFDSRVSFKERHLDAFQRLRVSNPFTLFECQMRYQENGKFDTLLVGSGTTVYNKNESTLSLRTTSASGDRVLRESKRVFLYQPGKSLLIINSFVFSTLKTNLRQRVGYYGAENGVFLEADGTQLYLVLRSNVTGTPSDVRKVPQSEWNKDTFDGQGASGRILDVSKANLLSIDIEWLGVGDVRVGFMVDGEIVLAHTFHNENIATTTYMTTACLPIRYEIENTGVVNGNNEMRQICSTVISEGGVQGRSLNYSVGRDLTNLRDLPSANVFYPVLSIRLKPDRLDSIVVPDIIDLLGVTNNATYIYQVRLNASIPGNSFANVSLTGAVQYDLTATSVTGGTILNSGFLQTGTKGGSIDFGSVDDFNFQIGRTIAGVSDTFTLCVLTDTPGSDVGAIMGWNELV
jgi:hypothetical protein